VSLDVHVADFVTIGLLIVLEGLLSADNALVMAVMVLSLPRRDQTKALRYGLVGAFIFRTIATLLATSLIQIVWIKLLGGLYLLYLSYQHFRQRAEHGGATTGPPPAQGWLGLSPFWGTVVRVEVMNLAFSIDSILVAVAMSNKTWVILTGGLLGIVALRIVVGQLLGLIKRFPALVDGAFVIIAWVGIKLLLEYAHEVHWIGFEVPRSWSIGLIIVIFILSYIYARRIGPVETSDDDWQDPHNPPDADSIS
jgi:YkoY family integral membrane protein